jgi:4-hydroxy 2-oxovalerate aldolase
MTLLDCTIRDGGYLNNWAFPIAFAKDLYRATAAAGIEYVELGFFKSDTRNKSPWANYSTPVYSLVRNTVENGPKIACMLNYGDGWGDLPDADETQVDMLRIACHKEDAHKCTRLTAYLADKGYTPVINYMGIHRYSPAELAELCNLVAAYKERIFCFYAADSFGCMMPDEVSYVIDTMCHTGARIGFHAHNNIQTAFINSVVAREFGASMIDCSINGMGRGGGNLPTELIVGYLQSRGFDLYDVLPILEFLEPQHSPYHHQMISGMLKCHPNYATELDRRGFSDANIYKALKEMKQEQKERYSCKF